MKCTVHLNNIKFSLCLKENTDLHYKHHPVNTTRKIIAVGCENHIKHIWRQIECYSVTAGGTNGVARFLAPVAINQNDRP